jgi:hypothetical protein
VLEAGVGGSGTTASAPRTAETEAEHDHGELAWRLRHARRSVLREATASAAGADGAPGDDEPSLFGESVGSLARAVDTSARLATALFADLELQGQLNLLTSASFDRPEELFSSTAGLPRSVAYLALSAPAARGEWRARGAITQGDLSSWLVAGTFTSQSSGAHAYEAGFSYGMQRYFGANAEALAALRDGSRNAAAVYAYDTWRLTPRVRVGFGGEYASYDYLPQAALLSPRISVSVKPVDGDPLLLRATVAHRETAPGAVEFRVPDGDVWVPPERTFSAVSAGGFRPERLDHVEVGAERQLSATTAVGVRVFRQRVQDQAVTVFGSSIAQSPSQTGHYYVGSAGDVEALGWGVTFTREVADGVRASLDYTQAATEWVGASLDRAVLARFAGSALRAGERLHDLTASIESVVPVTATRLFVVYKLNTAFSSSADSDLPGPGARFNVQISQSLPFLKFTSARWEALVAVRNVFTEDVSNASVYDELLVVRPPKRVLGGVTVKF